jgi:hypothetical protein
VVLVVVEESPDVSGEVAFEAAEGFASGFAFGAFGIEIGAGGGVGAGSHEGDDVDRFVELTVAAAVQSVSLCFAAAGGDRRGAGLSGELRLAREPFSAGGLADQDRGGDGPDPLFLAQGGVVRGCEVVEFVVELDDLAAERRDLRELPASDPDTGCLPEPGEAAADLGLVDGLIKASHRDLTSSPSWRAKRSASACPASLAAIVRCPACTPVALFTATSVCDRLWMSTPITIIPIVPS